MVHWLSHCRSSKAVFLRVYSQYLVGSVTSPDHIYGLSGCSVIVGKRKEGSKGVV